MSVYENTALKTFDMPGFRHNQAETLEFKHGGHGIDLLAYPDCDEYISSTMSSPRAWHSMKVEKRPCRLNWKKNIEREKYVYKELYFGGGIGSVSMDVFTRYASSITFLAFFFMPLQNLLFGDSILYCVNEYKECYQVLLMTTLCFISIKYFQHRLWHNEEDDGYYLNRRNGMIERRLSDGTHKIPFNEFRPVIGRFSGSHGQSMTNLMLYHDKMNHAFSIPARTPADAIIAWTYLKHFMDISRPLPDIPEHETTRHLDPTTKEHDAAIGRDPFYWRKKSYKELKDMEKQAEKRKKEFFIYEAYFR